MEARDATRQDLAAVFRQLAPRMADEYVAAVQSVRRAKDVFVGTINSKKAHALVADDRVLAIVAWQIENGVLVTSFAAQESFFEARYVSFCRRHVAKIAERENCKVIRSISYSRRPDTPRWFAALKFKMVQEGSGFQIFERVI